MGAERSLRANRVPVHPLPERSMSATIRVGTAGWTIPGPDRARFAEVGSQLERYATRFAAVEINSSFHRPHRPTTYARWAASVPESLRFSVKLPRLITHELRLQGVDAALDAFLAEAGCLGGRLGCLLVQLPPSLELVEESATAFFQALRARAAVPLACEPRHPSWFSAAADDLLAGVGVARVAADPARVPAAAEPGGARVLCYVRLHGSPRMYYSSYSPEYLDALANTLEREAAAGREVWCVFDNTAHGAATGNALDLLERLGG
jgi:uncharacterized protein YecE (DUF72 family)